jgi:hypothetical protein
MKIIFYIGISLLIVGFCLADSKSWFIPVMVIFAGCSLIYVSTKFIKDEKVNE